MSGYEPDPVLCDGAGVRDCGCHLGGPDCFCEECPGCEACAPEAAPPVGAWKHPLDPEVPPPVLPLARTHPELLERRELLCRRCGQPCGTPGATHCGLCAPLRPADAPAAVSTPDQEEAPCAAT